MTHYAHPDDDCEFRNDPTESFLADIARVTEFGNPLTMDPWRVGISPEMIAQCLETGRLLGPAPIHPSCEDPMEHAARIAWLVMNGWSDPITFDAGMPHMYVPQAPWPFLDGNHRLAAAIYRGDQQILVSVDGDIEHGMSLLLDDVPEPEPEFF